MRFRFRQDRNRNWENGFRFRPNRNRISAFSRISAEYFGFVCSLVGWGGWSLQEIMLLYLKIGWVFLEPLVIWFGTIKSTNFGALKIGQSISSLARFFTIVSSNFFTQFSQISGPQIVQENIRQLSNTFPVIRQIMLKHYRLIIKWLAVFITSRLDHQLEKHVFSCSMDTV